MLTEMYHDHGDSLALQYTGSALINQVETYRHMPHWNSHSRDIIEHLRCFYQTAINPFLGMNPDWQTTCPLQRDKYQKWYKEEHLEPAYMLEDCQKGIMQFVNTCRNYWIEYHRPKHIAFSVNSILKLPGLMDGIRRWISSSPASNAISVDQNSTKYIAEQLMNQTVSLKEENEYEE
ncbi:uncharacterized protein LAESUDRAFT_737768 [Laetiporus sulphureus 93-53]|uniref:Uncharacterized protein n=1 Tax=Laetiporus sulphureus 93-53 TaxID=1314785 RepID=A0A165DEJ8_9APHY|nr:uncharacterized protein LAESUDRAFT_737768 [Laetiporus sulphureus 93-53]KZT04711.1 hypothetical protein LAESUDRAFT_737768 [Laetiporus sulphureus 93-53]